MLPAISPNVISGNINPPTWPEFIDTVNTKTRAKPEQISKF